MATIIDGKELAKKIRKELKVECDNLKEKGLTDSFCSKTGLIIDAYFSATKLRWILEHVPGARERAEKGELLFGTVETWLIWKLTKGRVHVTDYSNCTTNKEFQEWLFSINSDGKTIEQAGVKFNVRNIYDPETSIPGIMIEIVEGVAEYHKEEFLNEMVAKLKADLKNQRLVLSIYPEYDWVIINLVNEHEFNNVN